MTFFNKKEEVLDIQLTQLGKYLLSKGKLKPKFYTFSDDEVLYNPEYAGVKTETARQTSDRIQKDTQRLKTLYEHDGVESRILSLNGHSVEKIRGHEWQARIRGRTEEMAVDQAYGVDTVTEDHMGADDRNLVRNFIGNSTIGEKFVPSWNIESLLDGRIESVNISSSSPNIGIKRPILTMEVDFEVEGSPQDPTSEGPDVRWENYQRQSGYEKVLNFIDNYRATVTGDSIVLSVLEENVDYDLENFEFEFYEIEQVETNTKANNEVKERLRRLYFSNNMFHEERTKYIQHYFDVQVDQELADFHGTDIHGVNRFRVRDKMKLATGKVLSDRRNLLTGEFTPSYGLIDRLGNVDGDCE